MFDKIVNFYKEVKRLMDKKYEAQVEIKKEIITTCKEAVKSVMSNAKNRVTVGLTVAGAGVGLVAIGGALVASAYIHVPA